MAWVKLDDQFFAHPKILAAGKDGQVLFIAGLCYSAAYLTDGKIDRSVLPVIAATARVRGAKSASRLVEVGLWHETDQGWEIHDYHDHQPTAEVELKKRADRAEAGRRGGLKSRPSGSKAGSKPEANSEANGKGNGTPSPSPSPKYPPHPPSGSEPETPPEVAGAGAPTEEELTEATLDHLAAYDLQRARADGTVIRNETSYLAALRKTRTALRPAIHEAITTTNSTDPSVIAELVDPDCEPLDGGRARAQAQARESQKILDEYEAIGEQGRAERAEAEALIAALTDDQRADLEARAAAAIPMPNPTLIKITMRRLIREETHR